MKQFLCIGVLAVSALLGIQERASAWVRFKFCAGMNAEFTFHGADRGFCFWRRCGPPPADCQNGWPGHQHAFAGQPQNYYAYYGTQAPAANAPAPPSAAPTTQPPPDPSISYAPSYSNFYGQYYYQPAYYQPASYYPDEPQFRLGINFGR
jgi:hypothetical protein